MNRLSKLIVLLCILGAVALAACKPKQEPNQQQTLDPAARLYINVTNNPMRVTAQDNAPIDEEDPIPTPREVVEDALTFLFTDPETGKIDTPIAISEKQLDLEHERIMMWGGMIINDNYNKEGRMELCPYFLKVRDLRILGHNAPGEGDNIVAYVPNKVMEAAEISITQAYNEGRYDDVYREFQELYTAIPTTTKRWRALKAKGEQ